jgi:hypothetical protein
MSKVSKIMLLVSIPPDGIPKPEFSTDKDIDHYKADMSIYFGQYPEIQKDKLILTVVKCI